MYVFFCLCLLFARYDSPRFVDSLSHPPSLSLSMRVCLLYECASKPLQSQPRQRSSSRKSVSTPNHSALLLCASCCCFCSCLCSLDLYPGDAGRGRRDCSYFDGYVQLSYFFRVRCDTDKKNRNKTPRTHDDDALARERARGSGRIVEDFSGGGGEEGTAKGQRTISCTWFCKYHFSPSSSSSPSSPSPSSSRLTSSSSSSSSSTKQKSQANVGTRAS